MNELNRIPRLPICSITLLLSVIYCAAIGVERAQADQPRDNAKQESKSQEQEFVAAALTPFWRASEIREPMFFIQSSGNERPTCNLLFKPTEILSVRSATRATT